VVETAYNVQTYFSMCNFSCTSMTTPYLVPMYIRTSMYVSQYYIYTPFSTIDDPRPGDVRAPSWANGLDGRGETIISEFRGTGFAGSAVRGRSRTRRGTVVSSNGGFYFFIFIFF
jgi:hypothetical protein